MKFIIATAATISLLTWAIVEIWSDGRGDGYKSGYSQCLGEQDDDKPEGEYRIGTR